MEIRPYHAEDDPHLLELERLSARGFPRPFVHFRQRFVDRAELYRENLTLVVAEKQQIIGVTSIALKDTFIGGLPVKVAYSFDTRVHPAYRRHGIGHSLVEEKLKWAKSEGAVGVYCLIVTTNQASLGMVAKSGYKKVRLALYLEYLPSPTLDPPDTYPLCLNHPFDHDVVDKTFYPRDLYVPYVAERVRDFDFQRWAMNTDQPNYVGLSTYNQSRVYMQIDADAPWPRTPKEIERLGHNLQIFDEVGIHHPQAFHQLFNWVRDEAVANNVNKLTWLVDRIDPIPTALIDDSYHQKDYWLLFKSFLSDWEPQWSERVFLDPRDL